MAEQMKELNGYSVATIGERGDLMAVPSVCS